jgi:lipopolysaccharide/colanic/teichoic acid biosynthesis glycosyltransferase
MDIILSLVALVILSPVMAVIAILVKLSSPGPIFYRQERCGLNGESFDMLKFRSLKVDAEK